MSGTDGAEAVVVPADDRVQVLELAWTYVGKRTPHDEDVCADDSHDREAFEPAESSRKSGLISIRAAKTEHGGEILPADRPSSRMAQGTLCESPPSRPCAWAHDG